MFDPAYDGVDDIDTHEGAQMRASSLDLKDWFRPLWDDEPVHPLAKEQ